MTVDSTVVVAAIAAAAAVIVAMLQRNHNAVNGRMTELLELTRKNSRAEGIKEAEDKNNAH